MHVPFAVPRRKGWGPLLSIVQGLATRLYLPGDLGARTDLGSRAPAAPPHKSCSETKTLGGTTVTVIPADSIFTRLGKKSFNNLHGTAIQVISAKKLLPLSALISHHSRKLPHATLKTATTEYGAYVAFRWRDVARRTAQRSFRVFSRIRGDASRLLQPRLTAAPNCKATVDGHELSVAGETSQPFRCLELISRYTVFVATPFSGPSISNQELCFDEHITHVARLS
jgi:hypothetical protein